MTILGLTSLTNCWRKGRGLVEEAPSAGEEHGVERSLNLS